MPSSPPPPPPPITALLNRLDSAKSAHARHALALQAWTASVRLAADGADASAWSAWARRAPEVATTRPAAALTDLRALLTRAGALSPDAGGSPADLAAALPRYAAWAHADRRDGGLLDGAGATLGDALEVLWERGAFLGAGTDRAELPEPTPDFAELRPPASADDAAIAVERASGVIVELRRLPEAESARDAAERARIEHPSLAGVLWVTPDGGVAAEHLEGPRLDRVLPFLRAESDFGAAATAAAEEHRALAAAAPPLPDPPPWPDPRKPRGKVRFAIRLLTEVTDALRLLHAHGIVHGRVHASEVCLILTDPRGALTSPAFGPAWAQRSLEDDRAGLAELVIELLGAAAPRPGALSSLPGPVEALARRVGREGAPDLDELATDLGRCERWVSRSETPPAVPWVLLAGGLAAAGIAAWLLGVLG